MGAQLLSAFGDCTVREYAYLAGTGMPSSYGCIQYSEIVLRKKKRSPTCFVIVFLALVEVKKIMKTDI